MTLPQQMDYIEVTGKGDASGLQVSSMAVPQPKSDEVLIRVHAAGVNRPDIAQRKGTYPPPPGASPVLGLEVAGEVVATGTSVTLLREGDLVCALTNGGGYAHYCTAPETQCLPWPDHYDALHAAAIPENYFTVWSNLFLKPMLQEGESLLVHGGTSGIGITATQLASEFGHKVYTTAGSTEKCAASLKAGATRSINYKDDDFEQRIASFTGDKGVDVILDMVGGDYLPRNLNCLAKNGRLVQIAVMQGAKAEINLAQVMTKRLIITGSTLRPRTASQKAAIAASLHAHVWPLLSQGRVRPVIFQMFPFAQAASAHQLMESSRHIGKIMLNFSR